MTVDQVLELARSERVKFLRLQFTDILGVIKNAFTVEGRPGHEIDFVYAISVAEVDRLREAPIVAIEADGTRITCLWKPVAAFHTGERLYPPGLLELLL
jgi:glutamine synthetase